MFDSGDTVDRSGGFCWPVSSAKRVVICFMPKTV